MWIVELKKPPTQNDYRSDYFPRRFHYKKEALDLIAEVQRKGGEAVVRKDENFPRCDTFGCCGGTLAKGHAGRGLK